MRIGCPNCAAEYEVPDRLLAAGPRLLRCAKCAHQFEAALPVEQAAAPGPAPAVMAVAPPPEPVLAAAPALPVAHADAALRAPVTPRHDRVAAFGWVGTVLLLVAGGLAGIRYRTDITEAWPPAARLFQALGLG
jgi:predicted Zn finger-like uncharacterized protein